MSDPAGRVDPRTIITPDAFSVAPELLGLALAHPWRRAVAIAVDLVLVAILANAQGVFFAFAAGLFVFWLATRRREKQVASTGRRVARYAFGCLGAVTLVVAGIAIWATVFVGVDEETGNLDVAGHQVNVPAGAFSDLLRLARGGDSAEVAAAADRLVGRLQSDEMDAEEMRSVVRELGGQAGVDSSLALRELEAAIDRRATDTGAVRPDTLERDTLFARYAEARAADDSVALARYGPALGRKLAADELQAAETEQARLRGEVGQLEARLSRTQSDLEEAQNRGLLSTVYGILDDVGLSLGWAGLYFTFFLGWWKGRTPGKRLLGIRVVRLDGKPLGYWAAFERYGGYAASLFTGLEGFGRLIWDPNRQALEDKLAGTVVLRDTAEARAKVDALHARAVSA
ncbi:MAG: RDD family protein [Gemmatimonadales bacterium]|jgi:hypothetical protein